MALSDRISLAVSESLGVAIRQRARAEGISVTAWIVKACQEKLTRCSDGDDLKARAGQKEQS